MGELGLNKIFGAILAAALGIMGLQLISDMVFSSGGHHGHHGEEKPYNEAIKDKYAYWTEVAMVSSGVVDEGPAYDLGLLLASADASKGERVFKSVCASCHTINQGGPNGTGPNLYALVNSDIAKDSSFGYSSALAGVEGNWTYEQLDAWIIDPKNLARGVNMVANVKKDPDRANLIAYLAANTPNAPAFPDPLPEEGEAVEGEDAPLYGDELLVEGGVEPTSADETAAEETPADVNESGDDAAAEGETGEDILDEMEAIVDDMEAGVERLDEIMDDAAEDVADAASDVEDAATEAVEAVQE